MKWTSLPPSFFMQNKLTDPWSATVQQLRRLAVERADSRAPSSGKKESRPFVKYGVIDLSTISVRVIDRPSESTATIVWRDPTTCCYGDQLWRASVARESGTCAVSGRPINQGDEIYRPRRSRHMPANAVAMILLSVVHDTKGVLENMNWGKS